MKVLYTSAILAILSISGAIGGPESSKSKNGQILPEGTECGTSASAPNVGRIVGGEEAIPHSWPWQVLIQCKYHVKDGWYERIGGGSIISNEWVVTVAHLITTTEFNFQSDCKVKMGKHDITRPEFPQRLSKIAKYVVHEKFDPVKSENGFDLALIKLAKRLKFTNAIKPICLPFGLPELPMNTTCYATGWGITDYNTSKRSDKLKQISMMVREDSYCHNPLHTIARVICTGWWNRKEDVCNGDSGGPLSCKEHDRKWYLRGVLSRKSLLCDNSMATFTKVTAFDEWIHDTIARN